MAATSFTPVFVSQILACRYSVTHISLVSVLDGSTVNWNEQDFSRKQMAEGVRFGGFTYPELLEMKHRVTCGPGWEAGMRGGGGGGSEKDQLRPTSRKILIISVR